MAGLRIRCTHRTGKEHAHISLDELGKCFANSRVFATPLQVEKLAVVGVPHDEAMMLTQESAAQVFDHALTLLNAKAVPDGRVGSVIPF